MLRNIRTILPDDISGEVAYHLVSFFIELPAELESHYFIQMRRYLRDNTPPNRSSCIQESSINENDF